MHKVCRFPPAAGLLAHHAEALIQPDTWDCTVCPPIPLGSLFFLLYRPNYLSFSGKQPKDGTFWFSCHWLRTLFFFFFNSNQLFFYTTFVKTTSCQFIKCMQISSRLSLPLNHHGYSLDEQFEINTFALLPWVGWVNLVFLSWRFRKKCTRIYTYI